MGKYFIDIKDIAKIQFRKIYKSGDQATIKKLEKIMLELSQHPSTGIGNPELLKYNLSGLWSRRINSQDRIIYEIIEEPDKMVVVISALGHYYSI
jgi:toxin YoeB